jgi:hypothetical protein
LWGQKLKHVFHDEYVLDYSQSDLKITQEIQNNALGIDPYGYSMLLAKEAFDKYYNKFSEERLLKEALYQTPVFSLWDKDSTTMENTQENLINSLTALFTQPHLAPVQVDTPKGKVTLFEYITMIIAGQHVLLTDPELEKAIKSVKVDPMFEAVLQNNPHYDRKTLELLAGMIVETGLIAPNTPVDISKPITTFMPLTTEGFAQAGLFNTWYEMEFPNARKVISADPVANCLADLASAIKEVKLAPTKINTTLGQVKEKLNAPAIPVDVVVQAQAEVKKVVSKAPKAKKEADAGTVAAGTVPQKVAAARKRVAVKTADYDPFAE